MNLIHCTPRKIHLNIYSKIKIEESFSKIVKNQFDKYLKTLNTFYDLFDVFFVHIIFIIPRTSFDKKKLEKKRILENN